MSFPSSASASVDPGTGEMAGDALRYQNRIDDLVGLFADEAAFTKVARPGGCEVTQQAGKFQPSDRAGGVGPCATTEAAR